jgi:hypothetical protein
VPTSTARTGEWLEFVLLKSGSRPGAGPAGSPEH